MFGGLELKGPGDDDNNGAAPASMSAFGFLNSESPSAAAEPAVSSGFSFLNAGAPPAESSAAPEPPSAALSGFSFLMQDSSSDPTPAAAPEVAVETTNTGAESSAFSFMIPSPDKPPETFGEEDLASSIATNAGAAASSAFSFLSAGTSLSTDEAEAPPAPAPAFSTVSLVRTGSTASSIVSNPSPVPSTNVMDFPTTTSSPSPGMMPGLPTGAGITFGNATSNRPVVRKKKTRAQKIGMGGPPPAAASTMPPPPVAVAPAPASSPQKAPSPKETRDAAAEAQRRAEEFMTKKTIAEATQATSTTANPTLTIPTYDDNPPSIGPTSSTDEEVAQARRAAEEAQKMAAAASNAKEVRGGFMGTFFKGFGPTGGIKGGSGHARRASPPPTTTQPMDAVTRKQQEMKRAAAERQMHFQQQSKAEGHTKDNDDDVVVVSTSVSGYHQTEAPTFRPAVPPATKATTKSFEPIAPVASPKIVVRELAPTPKKKKTPTQAFEEYQALFAQSVHRAMQQVEAVRSQQKMLSEERFVSIAKERLATQQIQQTEAQLQVAVDNEDYELADQLGQVIDAHKREKAEVASVLDSIAKGLVQLESQKGLVVRGVATCFDNLALHIKELQEQETIKERDTDSDTFKQFETISKQLSAEQERLNHDYKVLERDEQLVAEERSELESAISEQSGEYERQRDSVKDKLSTIEEEIAELRRQLEAKSKIAAGLRTEMHGLEDNISKVRVKFSRQLARVDKKERGIQENRLEWETEKAIFQRQKEAHELQVQTHSEALLAHDALMKTLDKELKLCKDFAGMVSTKLGFMSTDSKSKEAEDAEAEGNLAQLQADVVKCEAACSEAKVILKAAVAAVSNLEAEHAMLIARVPQLEAEKKAAAAKRDFKAASKASKEIKDASTRLKECEEELLGEAAEKKKAAEEELAKLTADLARTRKIAEEEEKVSGIARMHDLAQQIKNLVATKEELCGDAAADDNTVKGVGAFVLDGQIKALKDEGQDLGSKYGGWNELIKDIFGEETPSAEDSQPVEQEAQAQTPAPAPVDDGYTSQERVANVRSLIKRIQEAEEALDAAAAREDYEEAARLQEVFENLQMDLENINLTDEESELAFADEEPAEVAPTESAEDPVEADDAENDEGAMEVATESATADDESPPGDSKEDDGPEEATPQEDDPISEEAPDEAGEMTVDDNVEEAKETKEAEADDSTPTKDEELSPSADDPVEVE